MAEINDSRYCFSDGIIFAVSTNGNDCCRLMTEAQLYLRTQRGQSMRGRVATGLKTAFLSITFIAEPCAPVEAAYWSALKSPEWPQTAESVATIKLFEEIPGDPDRTKKFEVAAVDVCTAANGVSFTAKASLACGASSGAFFKTPPWDGDVIATVTLDIGACRITESNIEISGDVGGLLSSLPQTQQFARSWAQCRLSHFCGV